MTRLGIRRDLIYIVLFVFLLSISYVSSTWTYTDPIHANDTYVTNLTVSDNLTLPTSTPITTQYGNLYACSGGVCYVNDTNQENELINKSYADANYGGGTSMLSGLSIDTDKDWQGYNITNVSLTNSTNSLGLFVNSSGFVCYDLNTSICSDCCDHYTWINETGWRIDE